MKRDWITWIAWAAVAGAVGPACKLDKDDRPRTSPAAADSKREPRPRTEVDLATCQNTLCAEPADDAPQLDDTARSCEASELGELRVKWAESFVLSAEQGRPSRELDCGDFGRCTISGFQLATGRDGTLFVLGVAAGSDADGGLNGLWLARYGADGRRRAATIVASKDRSDDRHATYAGAIAVDERGHPFVVVARQKSPSDEAGSLPELNPDTSIWMVEYDADLEPLTEGVAITGYAERPWFKAPRPLATSFESLALAESQLQSGSIALLSLESNEAEWVQTREGRTGIGSAVVDDVEEVTVLALPTGKETSTRIEHYTPGGELTWERSVTLPDASETGGGQLSLDRAGNLLHGRYDAEQQRVIVHQIAPGGVSVWGTAIAAPSASELGPVQSSGQVVVAPDGTLYVLGTAGGLRNGALVAGETRTFVYELSADGGECGMWRVAAGPSDGATQLIAAEGGAFFFAGESGFGRLERP